MVGDSYIRCVVYDVPEDQVDAVLDVLEDNGLALESQGDVDEAGDGLLLGVAYQREEVYSDLAHHVGEALAKDAPGATFDVSTDPADGEGLGIVFLRAPDLGSYEASCSGDGEPLFPLFLVEKVIGELPETATRDVVAKLLDERMGGPWMRRMTELRKADDEEAVEQS